MILKDLNICSICDNGPHRYLHKENYDHSFLGSFLGDIDEPYEILDNTRIIVIGVSSIKDLMIKENKLYFCFYKNRITLEPQEDNVIATLLEFDENKKFDSFDQLLNLVIKNFKLYLVFQ